MHRHFVCVVDAEGDGKLREPAGSPVHPLVVSGPPERLMAAAPSIVAPGEAFTVRASVVDRNLTHPNPRYGGPVRFLSQDDVLDVPDAEPIREGDARALAGVRVWF